MTSTPMEHSGMEHAGTPRTPSAAPNGGPAGWEQAAEMADRAGLEAGAKLGTARQGAATRMDTLAESARAASERLRGSELGPLSDYVDRMADGMQRFSGGLRERSGDELLQDVGRMARENPGLFVSSGIAIGFGLSRFAKAASPDRRSTQEMQDAGKAKNADDIVAVQMPSQRPIQRREICP